MADPKYPEDNIIELEATRLKEMIERVRNSHYQYDCLQFLESNGENPCTYCSGHDPVCGYYRLASCDCGWNQATFKAKLFKKGNKV